MAWVDLSNNFAYGSKLTSTQMQNLRDNIPALANGDSGAPEIQTAALADDCVTNAKLSISAIATAQIADDAVTEAKQGPASVNRTALKTSTGYASGTLNNASVNVEMQDYNFYPSVWGETGGTWDQRPYRITTEPSGQTGRMMIINTNTSDSDYSANYRYVTATDRPFMYAIRDKNGIILHIWACDDPPTQYWNMKKKPVDFVAPVVVSDLKGNEIAKHDEITIFDYNLEEYKHLVKRSCRDKKLLHRMLTDDFELPRGQKIFRRKNLAEV